LIVQPVVLFVEIDVPFTKRTKLTTEIDKIVKNFILDSLDAFSSRPAL